ncbi:MAG: glucosyltransferase [Oscillibacter sp.]|nr:glucosyltransferase [Oscillibacter sp.]
MFTFVPGACVPVWLRERSDPYRRNERRSRTETVRDLFLLRKVIGLKIAWFCIPAHGHTNPTLALVRTMVEAGHEVDYFSFAPFREKIERTGARFVPCDEGGFAPEQNGGGDRVGRDLVYSTELIVNSTLALDERIAAWVEEHRPDLIVADSVAYWGRLTAMKYGIPCVSSTTTFAFNRYSAKYMPQSAGQLLKTLFSAKKIDRILDRLRERGYPVKSVLDIISNDNDTNTIVYTSKLFQPCAETFSDRYHFIGPSIRAVETPMERTEEETVYVSLGTVVRNEALLQNCIEALRETPCRVIVSLGGNDISLPDLPENVRAYPFVDQMAALSVADAFVTHCGMNSASEGLWFGVPLILCPQTSEQGAVARRTAELGAGVLPRSEKPKDLRAAIEAALNEPKYRAAAGAIAESFRSCGGAEEARAFLEGLA